MLIDPHLRSTKSLGGYHIQTREGEMAMSLILIDGKSWAIRHLVVETSHWFTGEKVVLSPKP